MSMLTLSMLIACAKDTPGALDSDLPSPEDSAPPAAQGCSGTPPEVKPELEIGEVLGYPWWTLWVTVTDVDGDLSEFHTLAWLSEDPEAVIDTSRPPDWDQPFFPGDPCGVTVDQGGFSGRIFPPPELLMYPGAVWGVAVAAEDAHGLRSEPVPYVIEIPEDVLD